MTFRKIRSKIHIFVLYCLTDGREHVVRVSVLVVCGAVL
jgi:hypothetical protein